MRYYLTVTPCDPPESVSGEREDIYQQVDQNGNPVGVEVVLPRSVTASEFIELRLTKAGLWLVTTKRLSILISLRG